MISRRARTSWRATWSTSSTRSTSGATLDTTVTVHDACHGLRYLGVKDAPRRLLAAAGATLVELTESETCCGFGGTFSLEHGEIATPLADDKLGHAAATAPRWLVSGDTACLLHLEGRRRRTGSGPGAGALRAAAERRTRR